MTARFDVVEIVVADMARSLAFYRHLGFDLAASADVDAEYARLVASARWRRYSAARSSSNGVGLA